MSSTNSAREAYAEAATRLREINHLEGINGLLGWDEMVMLPSGSGGCRGDQKSALAGVIYDKKTALELGNALDLLHNLEPDTSSLSSVEQAVVRDAHKDYHRTRSIPKELAQRTALLESTAYEAWVTARKASDFSVFQPSLEEWVQVNIERAKSMAPNAPIYDTLLDLYEKGMTTQRLDEVFTQVKEGLVPLLAELKLKGTAPNSDWLLGDYGVEEQARMCREIAIDLGFDTDKGRLDVSVHPFTGGSHPTDVRMTTRFKSTDLTEGLTGAIHETGHALYEQGRNLEPEWKDLCVSAALSMGVHESQSLLWERMVALGLPFQNYLLPKIRAHFPTFPTCTPDSLFAAQNTMRSPSLIRVEADEVQYSLHVILRFEVEKDLMAGTLKVSDVPRVWNEKMQAYLGCTPANDAEGCLQDIHWAGGAFGYFPTYVLGAMFAVQIFQAAKLALPDLDAQLSKGDFTPLRTWLNDNIHKKGSLYASGDELMVAVTGKPLDPDVFLAYLRTKYSALYKL